jgi:hypothetical protein
MERVRYLKYIPPLLRAAVAKISAPWIYEPISDNSLKYINKSLQVQLSHILAEVSLNNESTTDYNNSKILLKELNKDTRN